MPYTACIYKSEWIHRVDLRQKQGPIPQHNNTCTFKHTSLVDSATKCLATALTLIRDTPHKSMIKNYNATHITISSFQQLLLC